MKKIVLTGAPSSGKSSVIQELELRLQGRGREDWLLVPESAVILLKGGFPAPAHTDLEQIRAFQRAILSVQDNSEKIFPLRNPHAQGMILDRGKLDGTGFWPPGPEDYLRTFQLNLQEELARYDEVLFLDLPGEEFFGGVGQARFHDYQQSWESGRRLEGVWSRHPHFTKISAQVNLEEKVAKTIAEIERILGKI